jgi:hypothetical protein
VHRHAELLEVVAALTAAGGLAGRLDRRQQQGDQHPDDGDHHQQLDQREAGPLFVLHGMMPRSEREKDRKNPTPNGMGRQGRNQLASACRSERMARDAPRRPRRTGRPGPGRHPAPRADPDPGPSLLLLRLLRLHEVLHLVLRLDSCSGIATWVPVSFDEPPQPIGATMTRDVTQ